MIDQEGIQQAASAIIEAIGEDPRREGLVDTPRRIARMYEEFFSGLAQDPVEVLATGFEESHDELVVLRDIPFFSVCEHHFLPFYGTAHVGVRPAGQGGRREQARSRPRHTCPPSADSGAALPTSWQTP